MIRDGRVDWGVYGLPHLQFLRGQGREGARCCGHSNAVREDPKHQLVDHEDEADQGGAD